MSSEWVCDIGCTTVWYYPLERELLLRRARNLKVVNIQRVIKQMMSLQASVR